MKTIVNTSFHMPEALGEKFLAWVRKVYIPSATGTGGLTDPVLTRILTEIEPGTASFSVQFRADAVSTAELWHGQEAARLLSQLHRLMNGQLVYFTTYMEEL